MNDNGSIAGGSRDGPAGSILGLARVEILDCGYIDTCPYMEHEETGTTRQLAER